MKLLFSRRQQGFMALEVVLVVAVVGLVVGAGWLVIQNQNAAKQQAAIENPAEVPLEAPALAPMETPVETPVPPQPEPVPAPAPAPPPQPAPQTAPRVVRPTQSNCNGQRFSAYISNSGGAKSYWQVGGAVARTYSYKQEVKLFCEGTSPAGWALNNDDWINFSDVSLTAQ